MNRRTLLQGAVALPVGKGPIAATTAVISSSVECGSRTIYSGLAGLDFALGGIEPSSVVALAAPSRTGKTLLLLGLAARVVSHYSRNVVFYGAHEPAVYVARQLAQRGDVRVAFGSESLFDEPGGEPAIHLAEASACDPTAAFGLAERLRQSHRSGCALLIMDGFSSYAEPPLTVVEIDGIRCLPAQRWPYTRLEADTVSEIRSWATGSTVPVAVGLKTPSLLDSERPSDLECMFRGIADRWVVMYRPEIYFQTPEPNPKERNVVCLTGTSPHWWDERCSRMRFRPADRKFETMV